MKAEANTITQSVSEISPRKLTTILVPEDMPETYAMTCDGDCLKPKFNDGQKIYFSRDKPYRTDDFVLLFFKREFVRPGDHQLLVKKLVVAPPHGYWRDPSCNARSNITPTVIVEMLNPRQFLYFNPAHLLGIHKCLGLVPKGVPLYRVSDVEVKAAAQKKRRAA